MESIVDKIRNIKVGSNKPYLITSRDALIITVITLMVAIVMYLIWVTYKGSGIDKSDLLSLSAQTVGATFVLQFAYEYLGLNAMILESSLRYAKGSPLGNFITTRSAMIYNVRNALGPDPAMDTRLRQLLLILNAPLLRSVKKHIGKPVAEIATLAKTTQENVELLLRLGDGDQKDYLRGATALAEIISEDIARYILLNGFKGFSLASGENAMHRETLAAVNKAALEHYRNEMLGDPVKLEEDYGLNWKKQLEKKCKRLSKLI